MSKKQFKTAVITDEISQDFEVALQLASKYKLDGVELRSVWETPPERLSEEQLKEIERLLKKYKQKVIAISSSIFKCDWGVKEDEKLEKTIKLAKRFECGFVRGFSFWQSDAYNDTEFAKIIKEVDKHLKKEGLVLVIEMDPTVNISNGEGLARIIKMVDSPNVRVLWDPGNDISDPLGEIPYPNGYDFVKNYIAHVHLKDAVKKEDGKVVGVAFGTGEVDFIGQFKALKKDKYNGYIVVETHYKKNNKEIDEDLLKNPMGSAFSEGGVEATEECLVNLFELLKNF